jgi:endothelin-converting enzyme/putative endopeptidase
VEFKELAKMVPHFDWKAYFSDAKVPMLALNVQQPKFMKEVDRQLAKAPLSTWHAYLTWQFLHASSGALSGPFEEETFAFYGRYLRGATEMKPRWKRCVETVDGLLGDALGRKYVEAHFPPEAKSRMQEMVKNIRLAMKDTITGLAWMGDETKQKALAKLATFNPKIGYPDTWKAYAGVTITRGSFWDDVESASRWNVADSDATIGKPVDRGRWGMTPPTSNAYYNPLLNEIVFPAGILQPPAFSVEETDAMNYGAIGVVIGHEISHGFDDQGAQYDAQGKLKNWWTPADLKKFQAQGQCVVDQFESYFHRARHPPQRQARARRIDRRSRRSEAGVSSPTASRAKESPPSPRSTASPRSSSSSSPGDSGAATRRAPRRSAGWSRAIRIPSPSTA